MTVSIFFSSEPEGHGVKVTIQFGKAVGSSLFSMAGLGQEKSSDLDVRKATFTQAYHVSELGLVSTARFNPSSESIQEADETDSAINRPKVSPQRRT
jgi:hypothetical protein